ncbi:hypothetical protein BO70DRAFT_294673 [Aspergillus heteromorphus CBS 117.55]|uniref:Uncharacterized protein n=1 Tax=Aspergillus heteromorphus CBS 117.55 TaxID=1448321 RepID=A0A317VT44_9EURO|nr:uncharacterized protein BO70DRAFT_294673 [Aspergillus heteromorphus CBS 117.55]PWY77493.1 hypothetical protein BO70DRAFT_294673 [Aspergillus heteromorphus CBS 117.55]
MGKTFKNIHACSAGKFDVNADKIPQWIRANGGHYSKDIGDEITHLIVSKEAYKNDIEIVRKAKRVKSIKIVSFDWLEDSLQSKNRRPKRETEYLLENILMAEKKANEKKKGKRERSGKKEDHRSEDARSQKKRAVNPKPEDPFRKKKKGVKAGSAACMSTRVTYDATLVRLTVSRSAREKYVIRIYESNKEPLVYATHIEYSRIGKQQSELLTPMRADRDTAVKAFKTLFHDKTGMEWENRLDGILPPCKRDAQGNMLPPHEGWFYYENREGSISSFLRAEVVEMTVEVDDGPSGEHDNTVVAETLDRPTADLPLDLQEAEAKKEHDENNTVANETRTSDQPPDLQDVKVEQEQDEKDEDEAEGSVEHGGLQGEDCDLTT